MRAEPRAGKRVQPRHVRPPALYEGPPGVHARPPEIHTRAIDMVLKPPDQRGRTSPGLGSDPPSPTEEQPGQDVGQKAPSQAVGGDASRAALNAAALQTLSMSKVTQDPVKPMMYVHRGHLYYHKPAAILAGVKSQDTSYLADTAHHGGSSAPVLPRLHHKGSSVGLGADGAEPKDALWPSKRESRRSIEESAGGFVPPIPSSRAEAVATADQLRRALSVLRPDSDVTEVCPSILPHPFQPEDARPAWGTHGQPRRGSHTASPPPLDGCAGDPTVERCLRPSRAAGRCPLQ